MKYKVYYKKTGAEIYENIMEVVTQYATLTEIDQFSNYSIAISLVNDAALESDLTTEYYIGSKYRLAPDTTFWLVCFVILIFSISRINYPSLITSLIEHFIRKTY